MIAFAERVGDRLLGLFVPSIKADAAGAGASFVRFCYCRGCRAWYKNCNTSFCGACNLLDDCPSC